MKLTSGVQGYDAPDKSIAHSVLFFSSRYLFLVSRIFFINEIEISISRASFKLVEWNRIRAIWNHFINGNLLFTWRETFIQVLTHILVSRVT